MSDVSKALDAIAARADAATEGPWQDFWPEQCCQGPCVNPLLHDVPLRVADALFIAHARHDVPALVAALRAVLLLVDEAEGQFSSRLRPGAARHVIENALREVTR